ncbi:hypothetical protein LR021_05450 [Candidatus Bipolaricaulota bacterium]|nr:hypothetical protein [Candidatus Bipolaricaulota bacterium]HBR09994.1 hypothetical protein [Candidatus Acetothermia bacterium]
MAPYVGRIAFTVGLFVLIFALIPLPFLERDSPEFVASLIAAAISSFWLGFIIWSIRRAVAVPKAKPNKNRSAGAKEKVNGIKNQTVQDKEGVVK